MRHVGCTCLLLLYWSVSFHLSRLITWKDATICWDDNVWYCKENNLTIAKQSTHVIFIKSAKSAEHSTCSLVVRLQAMMMLWYLQKQLLPPKKKKSHGVCSESLKSWLFANEAGPFFYLSSWNFLHSSLRMQLLRLGHSHHRAQEQDAKGQKHDEGVSHVQYLAAWPLWNNQLRAALRGQNGNAICCYLCSKPM